MFLVTLLPVLYLVVTSFTPLTLTQPSTIGDFSTPLKNYALLLSDTRLHESVWTQAKLSVFTVSLQLLLGLGAALLLHSRSSSTDLLRAVFLVPMVLPPIVVAVIWKVLYSPDISPAWWLFAKLNWQVPAPITDARLALPAIIAAETWEWFPFTMLIILAALKTMPEDWFEAARIDGAEYWQITWHITLPNLRGVLLVAGLFRLIDSIKTFPLIYILTDGGPGTTTEVTNYYVFVQAFNFSYIGYSSAVSVMLVISVVALSWFIVRTVEGGATSG
jgi:multiple sugar transport system permease protein